MEKIFLKVEGRHFFTSNGNVFAVLSEAKSHVSCQMKTFPTFNIFKVEIWIQRNGNINSNIIYPIYSCD